MTPEELDEARAKEAWRIWSEVGDLTANRYAAIAARLAREGWKPPEPPVDPDVLAFREWFSGRLVIDAEGKRTLTGHYDKCSNAQAYLAGARMAREQERERAKALARYVQYYADAGDTSALAAIAKYEEGQS